MDYSNQIFRDRRFARANFRFFAALLTAAVGFSSQSLWAANGPPESAGGLEAETPAEKTSKAEQQKKIAALVEQLGDKDYFVRQKAQEELSRMGFEAFEALTAAATNDDLEIATRAKYLLKLMRVEWTDATDPPEVKRLLKGYEMLDAENREERIHALAALPDGKATPALCRLARFEKSNVLSKRAALELMQSTPDGEPPSAQRANLIRKISRPRRPARRAMDQRLAAAGARSASGDGRIQKAHRRRNADAAADPRRNQPRI